MRIRRTVTAVAVLGGVSLAMSACSPLTVFGQHDTHITQQQIVNTISDPVAPTGFEWTPGSDDTATVSSNSDDMQDGWNENRGRPSACYDVYSASSLISSGDSGSALGQPDFALGRFDDSEGAAHYTILGVSARVFDTSAEAAAFVDGLSDAADACSGGYTLSSEGEIYWTATGVDFAEEPTLGASNVRAVSLEEIVTGDSSGAGFRTVFLERGNVVVAVVAELAGGESVRYTDQDDVASAVATALSDIRAS